MNAPMRSKGKSLYLTPELEAEDVARAEAERLERERIAADEAARAHRDKHGQWFCPDPLAHKMVHTSVRFALEIIGERKCKGCDHVGSCSALWSEQRKCCPDCECRPPTAPLRVVDAGAGAGAFTLELLARSAHVTAVEIDPLLSAKLKTNARPLLHSPSARLEVHTAEFVDWAKGCLPGEFDLCITNPPFHVLHHFVEAASKIAAAVVVLGPAAMKHGEKHEIVHDSLAPRHMRDLLRRPKFSGSSMQPRSDHAVLFGVPHTPETLHRSRHAVSYGVWRERWNPLKKDLPK